MVDREKAINTLAENNMYRELKGDQAITIWRSKNTDPIYFWYVIQDIPKKAKDPVVTVHESRVFYGLNRLLEELCL